MLQYFDVLPLHPQPEYLESLTSYLMRLAAANGILSVDGISTLCFPHQDRRITRDIADYLPVSLGRLATVGGCCEERLRLTTFAHLLAKFGRSPLPQPASRFLSGCVSHYLRYCPLCLQEQRVRYYPLFWRFLAVTCCHVHKCLLLGSCLYCNVPIPLFTSPLKLGHCPKCLKCLTSYSSIPALNRLQLEATKYAYDDVVFCLLPQAWENSNSDVIKRVGQQFSRVRYEKQQTAMEVSDCIGIALTTIENIERGAFLSRGTTFLSYLKYARYLQISLKEVFSCAVNSCTASSQGLSL